MNIIEAIDDPQIFGTLFREPSTWLSWRVALKAVFGLPLESGEIEIHHKHTGLDAAPQRQVEEAWFCIGRRGGKSFMSALVMSYLAVFRDWSEYLSFGETGTIMCLATDRKQARLVLNYVKAIFRLPRFRPLVKKERAESVELRNGIEIEVHTCSFRSLRGYTVLAAVCDELAFWRDEESRNPAVEVLAALRPAMKTVPNSLLVAISTPYAQSGPLWEAMKDWGEEDGTRLLWKAASREMNPTLNEGEIERDLAKDYERFKAEWLAEFRSGLSAFLEAEAVDSSIPDLSRFGLPYQEGLQYRGFVDMSGGRQDSSALSIAHTEPESGLLIQDRLIDVPAPHKPLKAVERFAEALKEYQLSRVTGDKYAANFVKESFQRCGIEYVDSKLAKSEIYLECHPLFIEGRLELLSNRKLTGELKALERRTRPSGKDSVDHAPYFHDDAANATLGSIWLCSSEGRRSTYHSVTIGGKTSNYGERGEAFGRKRGKAHVAGRQSSPSEKFDEMIKKWGRGE
jgi:hypothetical protein